MLSNVLAIEDCLDNQAILDLALNQFCHLFFASTLKEAKVILLSKEIHLVLLDINLPDGNGFEFFSVLRKDKQTDKIPIIFQTTNSSMSDTILCLTLGAEDYITKPYDILDLRTRVKSVLKKSGTLKTLLFELMIF